jgi:diguanylate cyclase (GGDEF)-like protein/PAS domain S-box-containing protein
MAQITLDAIGDAVLVVDPRGDLLYLNKVAEIMTGWSREEAVGRPVEQVFFVFDGKTRERANCPARQAMEKNHKMALTLGSVLIRRDGLDIAIEDSAVPIHDRNGKLVGAVIVFHDASRSGSVIQKLSHDAQHDFLTGLPNRMLLQERLTQAIGMANRHQKQIALLFVDLDQFKPVNDSMGHAVGDHLLRDVAAQISHCLRATDTVSRHGGDEFVILLTEIEKKSDAARIAEKVLARFSEPRLIDGHQIQVAMSIGIAVYPDNGLDADTLMRSADLAMYTTKASRQSSYHFSQQRA